MSTAEQVLPGGTPPAAPSVQHLAGTVAKIARGGMGLGLAEFPNLWLTTTSRKAARRGGGVTPGRLASLALAIGERVVVEAGRFRLTRGVPRRGSAGDDRLAADLLAVRRGTD